MFTDIVTLGAGNLGDVDKDSNGYITTSTITDPDVKSSSYMWTSVSIPYAGMTRFGLSWLICYEDSDGVKHYPYGDSDRAPNTITSYWLVDPRDGHCFQGRSGYEFKPSMVDAPTLDKSNVTWKPPTGSSLTTPPSAVDVYIRYGSGAKPIYKTRTDAIIYDRYGNFDGTNYYIDDTYCKIIYEYDYFVQIASDELRTIGMPDNTPVLYAADYPDMIWRVDGVTNNGMIYSPLIPGMTLSGAFKDVVTLEQVTIPHTCQCIGPVAFAGTSLRAVTIPSDCEYSETSFPEGCEVHFYGGGGDYGQLYDCNGYAVIDSDHARIYIS